MSGLIGKEGSNIKEVQRQSGGAKVVVQQLKDIKANARTRDIMISGTVWGRVRVRVGVRVGVRVRVRVRVGVRVGVVDAPWDQLVHQTLVHVSPWRVTCGRGRGRGRGRAQG